MSQPVLENFVRLQEGIPKELHLVDHALETVDLMDPLLGRPLPKHRLLFVVDEEDGRPVAKTWSILSDKLAAEMWGYLSERRYQAYTWVVTQRGTGYQTTYSVARIPRPGP